MLKVDIYKKIDNPFDFDSETKSKPKNATRGQKEFEIQSVQELENYAASKVEETTHAVNDHGRIVEVIKGDATRTLVTLHEKGDQINRTHEKCKKIDRDLSKVAAAVIHWIFRRTGRHLFLTDNDEGQPPLLKRRIKDQDNLYFMH